MDPSEYECAICQNLLLDPVVGSCGHDYCQSCLSRWRSASTRSSTVACPLCRAAIPSELGVCVRLRETIQRLFPEEVKKRRVEVQERKLALSAAGESSSSGPQESGFGEPAAQRARFTHSSSSGLAAVASLTALHLSRFPSRQGTRVSPSVPSTSVPTGTQPQSSGGVASASPSPFETTWVPPATLCFTLGWYDPAETRSRRPLGRRRRAIAA